MSQLLYTLYRGQPGHAQWVIACLENSWGKILGERLAAVCRPVSFEESHLRIEVIDQEWKDVLSEMRGDLLEKIRAVTGNEVKSVSFVWRSTGSEEESQTAGN